QHERNLVARLEDQGEALATAEEARRRAEELARTSSSDSERLAIETSALEKESKAQAEQLAQWQTTTADVQKRANLAESLVEDLKAKLRAGKEEARRLRGQLEATGLSD
ncbi:unnamed protein product, partial [Laminaria digitata]